MSSSSGDASDRPGVDDGGSGVIPVDDRTTLLGSVPPSDLLDSPRTPMDFSVSSPVAHALRRNSLAAIAAQQAEHGNEAEFSLAPGDLSTPHASVRGLSTHRLGGSTPRDGAGGGVGDGSSSESDDDTGALLRQSRARAASKSEIAARYTKDVPVKRPREFCDIPTIFNSTEEDMEYARSEDPTLGEWQLRAAAAVVRHRQSSTKVYSGQSVCSLSFRDAQAEQAFHYYFSSLNEHKLRRRLLLLNFLYMIYATVEWGTRVSKHYTRSQQNWITVLRVFYIVVNAIIFTLSFVKRNLYRRNINLYSTILAVLTSTLIIIEGHLLRNIYSPFVVIILIMYMVGSNIYVRTLYTVSVAVCWYNMILYNFMCLVFNPNGDLSTLHSTNAALLQLFYYDLIFIFFILTITFQTRKVEKQNRYAFLAYYIEVEQEEREREEEEKRKEKKRRDGGGASSKRKGRSSRRPAGDVIDEESESKSSPPPSIGSSTSSPPAASSISGGIDSHDSALSGGAGGVVGASSDDLPGLSQTRGHLLPRTKSEELDLLRELNAAERAEDPFYLSKVAAMFLPVQKVTHIHKAEDGGEDGATPTMTGVVDPSSSSGAVTSRQADGSLATTTLETVYSNDPLYTTLSIMRAKGITSMAQFVKLLAHQNKVRAASNKISELPCMCCASELPPWFTSYPYVETKYRCNYTKEQCFRSIFEWHNETINIWTEFVPCIVFLFGLIILESAEPVVFSRSIPGWDRFFVLFGLLGGVVIRPLCSGMAHTFYPMSNRAFIIWWGIDYVSILISIMGYGLVMGRFTVSETHAHSTRTKRAHTYTEWHRPSRCDSHIAHRVYVTCLFLSLLFLVLLYGVSADLLLHLRVGPLPLHDRRRSVRCLTRYSYE